MAKQQFTTAGILVHFMQDNGSHSAAIITSVLESEKNVVNLFIMRDDKRVENYTRRGVSYSEDLLPETWHFIEGHPIFVKDKA